MMSKEEVDNSYSKKILQESDNYSESRVNYRNHK